MQTYRIEATVAQGGKVVLSNLPFEVGETIEIIVLSSFTPIQQTKRYPMHGLPITYIDPTEPVAQTDWEVLQ